MSTLHPTSTTRSLNEWSDFFPLPTWFTGRTGAQSQKELVKPSSPKPQQSNDNNSVDMITVCTLFVLSVAIGIGMSSSSVLSTVSMTAATINNQIPIYNTTTSSFDAVHVTNTLNMMMNTSINMLSTHCATFLYSIVGIVSLLLAVAYYRICYRPLAYTCTLSQKEWLDAERRSLIHPANMPQGFPNTWVKLFDGFQIPTGVVRRTRAVGKHLAVWRATRDDKTKNLVAGRAVCVELNDDFMTRLTDSTALTSSFEDELLNTCVRRCVDEINCMCFLWHSESDPLTPSWTVPIVEGMDKWYWHGTVSHEIGCHIQEIPENGADTAHLDTVHGEFIVAGLPMMKHTWHACWEAQPAPNAHLAKMTVQTIVACCSTLLGFTKVVTNITQVGPSCVQLIFPFFFGRVIVVETVTPITPYVQRANNTVYAERFVPRWFAKFLLKSLVVQFERDHPIWNNKQFIRSPLVVKEDGPLLKYRRWVKQFYSNNANDTTQAVEQ